MFKLPVFKYYLDKMGRGKSQKDVSQQTLGKLIALSNRNVPVNEIALEVNLSRSQVYKWLRRIEAENQEEPLTVRRLGRCGRKKQLSAAEEGQIVAMKGEEPLGSSRSVRDDLNLNCSSRTVARCLNRSGLHCRRPARKVDLTNDHARQRLTFAQQNLNRDWSEVIFSDEKVFKTNMGAHKPIWRSVGTRYQPANVARSRDSGRITMSMWGWMSSEGPGELVRTGPRMNAGQYIRILEEVMLPSVRIRYPEPHRIAFVQDNSSVHKSRLVREWFANQELIDLIDWPAKSPDLNPIENLWAAVVREWNGDGDGNHVRTADALFLHAQRVWGRFQGRNICQNLVGSMPTRLQDTIANNGFWTRY